MNNEVIGRCLGCGFTLADCECKLPTISEEIKDKLIMPDEFTDISHAAFIHDKMSCVVCDKTLIQFEKGNSNQPWNGCWHNGDVTNISMGYGSKLDGDMYLIAICDVCVKKKEEEKKIRYLGDYMNPETNTKKGYYDK